MPDHGYICLSGVGARTSPRTAWAHRCVGTAERSRLTWPQRFVVHHAVANFLKDGAECGGELPATQDVGRTSSPLRSCLEAAGHAHVFAQVRRLLLDWP